jgi:hypothetical protein
MQIFTLVAMDIRHSTAVLFIGIPERVQSLSRVYIGNVLREHSKETKVVKGKYTSVEADALWGAFVDSEHYVFR